ncbi:universal stress protein [Oceanidesulfovibrio marinus]|uniref:Universal stress protein n=1 Tax=Oceanidesulfovibrio marinus TaxID=370038 RepID=A0ABX6NB88_9BACT|nr:universal stress protein [Oceanidesulfovibrio marinus]QJT07611.1 universal stress protein [Oceanidesulfovibrio marinus]
MEKHLLLTISNDQEASYNLRFIRHFFEELCDVRLTLFYVVPRAPEWMLDARDLAPTRQAVAHMDKIKDSSGKRALEHARRWIVESGCRPDKVETKVVYSKHGTVREISKEAHVGLYDACVLGRRGVSWFGELIEDSVSHRILWGEIDFPVWICRRPETGLNRDILLCVDDTDSSMRMADHVGFMLEGMRRHRVTMFHVRTPDDATDPDTVFDQARSLMVEAGMDADLIGQEVAEARNPVTAILNKGKAGNYTAVATGRAAGAPGTMERLFPGSVSTGLLRRIDDFALWISK